MGWFLGFKFNIVCNEKGGIVKSLITAD
ncbi:MAG: hypothetical protein J6W75_10175 [Bacteroidaceae bacterium]|nr:hypothetical protein [Bacteroidaceae bacterium]